MANEASVSESVDPLSGLNGPSLFPRTFRASAGDSLPPNFKDLATIHNFMKSLELRSPEKLMSEAKRIVEGGADLLESSLASFTQKVGVADVVAAKAKDRPRERRPGLGRTRKKGPFTLKNTLSQPSVSLEPSLNMDQLEDPDEFFDAYERLENAKKEIKKQLGNSTDNLNLVNPPTRVRQRRPGIFGKTYHMTHRYSSASLEDCEMAMNQDTVEQEIPACEDGSQNKLIDPDSSLKVNFEKVEPTVSAEKAESVHVEKAENEFTDILDELLSCNTEDLDVDGALNLFQERLEIKPLDLEDLRMPEVHGVGRIANLTAGDGPRKSYTSSVAIDSVLKNVKGKSPMQHVQGAQIPTNPVSSPTPPRSPFASLSLLKKRILQSNPLKDPFSPVYADMSACQDVSSAQDKLPGQDDAPVNLTMSSELKSNIDVEITETTPSNTGGLVGSEDNLPDQFADENASKHRINSDNNIIEETMINKNLNVNKRFSSTIPDSQKVAGSEEHHLDQFEDENASMLQQDVVLHEIPDHDTSTVNVENSNDYPSNLSVPNDDSRDKTSRQQRIVAENQPEVNQAMLHKEKRKAGQKRIRNAHPMRKSIAESGTSFEAGLRRSKRIKMRPLEYWKGERFVYGRMNDSMKLIGVKYVSPGKDNGNLKVKPFVPELPEYKELLDLAARH